MTDRRQTIIEAGLAVIREHGLAGFTQPRVAQLAGMRQSHLTYYFPTRLALLTGVAEAAVERQLGALAHLFTGATPRVAAESIARVVIRPENTRVLVALAEGAADEPALGVLFGRLTNGIAAQCATLFGELGVKSSAEAVALVHALSVGLAVIHMAQDKPDGEKCAANVLKKALTLLDRKDPS